MLIYWGMFSTFAVGALGWKGGRDRKTGLALRLAMIVVVLIVGLRWQIGPDWESYSNIYKSLARISFDEVIRRHDPAFYFVAWLLSSNGQPFWVLNFVMAAIFITGLTAFARTLPNPWLAITIAVPYLIIVVGMNLIRQAAAMGFVFLAFRYVGSKPLWKSIAWSLLASLFHASAIITTLLIAISYTKNRLAAFTLVLISAVPVYYVLFSTFDEYFQRYSHQTIDSGGVYFRLIINAVPAVIFLIWRKKGISPPGEYALWRNLSILSLCLLPLPFFVHSTTSIDRASMYAIPLQLLVLSAFPYMNREAGDRFGNTAALVFYSALTMVAYFSFGTHARYFAPYHWIFGS